MFDLIFFVAKALCILICLFVQLSEKFSAAISDTVWVKISFSNVHPVYDLLDHASKYIIVIYRILSYLSADIEMYNIIRLKQFLTRDAEVTVNFSVWLRTNSNPAGINLFRSNTENNYLLFRIQENVNENSSGSSQHSHYRRPQATHTYMHNFRVTLTYALKA